MIGAGSITRSRLFWVEDLAQFENAMGRIGVTVKHITVDPRGVQPPTPGAALVHIHADKGEWPSLTADQALSNPGGDEASQHQFYGLIKEFLIADEVAILEDLTIDPAGGFDHRVVVIQQASSNPFRWVHEWDHNDLIRLTHHASHPPFPNDRPIEAHHLIRGTAKAV